MTHTIRLTTPYGSLVNAEQVHERELPAALRRFYAEAMHRENAVVELDGIAHTRNSFLEFVRAFNECGARGPLPAAR